MQPISGTDSATVASAARAGGDHREARRSPYPPSELIAVLEWTGSPHKYPGTHTDMHWHAWAGDGSLYLVDDDGENFGNAWNFAHLLRVTGSPPRHHVEEVSTFPELRRPGIDRFRYVDGALAIGNRLYVAAYDYDWRDQRAGHGVAWALEGVVPVERGPEGFFMDAMSEHAGVAGLMYSDDGGETWQNVPDAGTSYFLGPKFAGLAFVGFGPGYTGVPEEFGEYVYGISNDQNWEGGDHIHLARAPKDAVTDRTSWEFWAGRGAGHWRVEPKWTTDEGLSNPIYTDYGYTGHPTMTWNAGLSRFMLAVGSDSTPHHWDVPSEVARSTWHRRRELNFSKGQHRGGRGQCSTSTKPGRVTAWPTFHRSHRTGCPRTALPEP